MSLATGRLNLAYLTMPPLLQEKAGSSCQCSTELQISKSISVQVGFISDVFSWKRLGLAEVGGERNRLRAWRGKDGKTQGQG